MFSEKTAIACRYRRTEVPITTQMANLGERLMLSLSADDLSIKQVSSRDALNCSQGF